jgi:hypothetical protein
MNLTYLEIDTQRSIYQNAAHSPGSAFFQRLVMSWLYHDHALEGVVLTPEDMHRAFGGLPARNYCEGVIYHSLTSLRDTVEFIHESAACGEELTLEWLREVHTRISPVSSECAGRYRKRDTSPGVYHLDVAQANSISYHFHKFLDSYRSELSRMHPVRQAAIAHWEFMKVFPFDEKTGVVGRLMMNFLLLKHDFPPAVIHATDRHVYFGALNGGREEMVSVVADAIRSTLSAARSAAVEEAAPRRAAF